MAVVYGRVNSTAVTETVHSDCHGLYARARPLLYALNNRRVLYAVRIMRTFQLFLSLSTLVSLTNFLREQAVNHKREKESRLESETYGSITTTT